MRIAFVVFAVAFLVHHEHHFLSYSLLSSLSNRYKGYDSNYAQRFALQSTNSPIVEKGEKKLTTFGVQLRRDTNEVASNSPESIAGGRLVASKSFRVGEILISLPLSMCILAHRSGAIRGLRGQTDWLWDICGDLRASVSPEEEADGHGWDVQLALALVDASMGTSLGGESEADGAFWDNYSSECLPKPEFMTVPFCMRLDESTVSMIQNDEIATAAIEQQRRLHRLFPQLSGKEAKMAHRITASALRRLQASSSDAAAVSTLLSVLPSPLEWAFAAVRSRCIQVDEDWFGMLPVIDMANHSLDPNAELNYLTAATDGPQEPLLERVICLCASRDIAAGEEITISYGDNFANRRLFSQYGFILTANPFDRIQWPAINNTSDHDNNDNDNNNNGDEFTDVNAALLQQTSDILRESLLRNIDGDLIGTRARALSTTLANRLKQILLAKQASGEKSLSPQILIENLYHDLLFFCNDEFKTTIEEDEKLLEVVGSGKSPLVHSETAEEVTGAEGNDRGVVLRGHLKACLLQRIERKMLLAAARKCCFDSLLLLRSHQ